jgi:hypothetical protein
MERRQRRDHAVQAASGYPGSAANAVRVLVPIAVLDNRWNVESIFALSEKAVRWTHLPACACLSGLFKPEAFPRLGGKSEFRRLRCFG